MKFEETNLMISGLHNPISKQIYTEASKKVETLSEFVYFVMVKISVPGVMLPSCLITVSNYLMADLKAESFFLPFPVA